jgi:hypothetical protein
MSGYANPDRPQQRLSNAEREEAVARLSEAQIEGRLTPAEYDERAAGVRNAVTRGDLAPLFADRRGRRALWAVAWATRSWR